MSAGDAIDQALGLGIGRLLCEAVEDAAAEGTVVLVKDLPELARGLTTGLYALELDDAGRFTLRYRDPWGGLPTTPEPPAGGITND